MFNLEEVFTNLQRPAVFGNSPMIGQGWRGSKTGNTPLKPLPSSRIWRGQLSLFAKTRSIGTNISSKTKPNIKISIEVNKKPL